MPAHLYGAGMPARVLNTRPTCPGGGQVPGTPKDRVVYGADVLLPCASLAPGLAEQPQESRETSNCGVRRNASDTCPRWEQGSPPTEWCRLPYGVASQGTDIRYWSPSGRASARSLADRCYASPPNGSRVRAGCVPKHGSVPKEPSILGCIPPGSGRSVSGLVSGSLGTRLKESWKTSQGVSETSRCYRS